MSSDPAPRPRILCAAAQSNRVPGTLSHRSLDASLAQAGVSQPPCGHFYVNSVSLYVSAVFYTKGVFKELFCGGHLYGVCPLVEIPLWPLMLQCVESNTACLLHCGSQTERIKKKNNNNLCYECCLLQTTLVQLTVLLEVKETLNLRFEMV